MNRITITDDLLLNLKTWLPITIGLLVLYIPTFIELSNSIWLNDDQSHGPFVLMIVCFLFWTNRRAFLSINKPRPVFGGLIFFLGLLMYILGRSQDIVILEISSLIPVIIGCILVCCGLQSLKLLWFPIFFIIFMVPLPSFIVGSITLPMKIAVSQVAEFILYNLNYPVARSGVILYVGQYQLLVADACAGMHTLISLEALGLLYLNLVKHNSVFRNITLALLIIPISFTANVIRVIVLILVTYYFGDEAGQGFVHGFAGMVLFFVALILIISVDNLLQFISYKFNKNGVRQYG